MAAGAEPADVARVAEAERVVQGPKFTALLGLLRRTGMSEFQMRYSDDESPVVWMAVGTWKVNREGRPVPHGRFTSHEACAGIDPYAALLRLAEAVIEGGGQCKHCGRPGGVADEFDQAMPLASVICWYQWDPELRVFRRGCEGDA